MFAAGLVFLPALPGIRFGKNIKYSWNIKIVLLRKTVLSEGRAVFFAVLALCGRVTAEQGIVLCTQLCAGVRNIPDR